LKFKYIVIDKIITKYGGWRSGSGDWGRMKRASGRRFSILNMVVGEV